MATQLRKRIHAPKCASKVGGCMDGGSGKAANKVGLVMHKLRLMMVR